MTGSDTAAMATAATDGARRPADAYPSAIASTITASSSGSGATTSSSATSSTRTAATTFSQRGAHRQSRDSENQHEHSGSFHFAPPPWDYLDCPSIIGVSLLTHTQRQSYHQSASAMPAAGLL